MQSDADNQSWMLLRALSNHIPDPVVNSFNAANDPSIFTQHHQDPVAYLSWFLHKTFDT